VAHHQQSPGSLGEAQPSRRVADEDGKSCHERAVAVTGVQSALVKFYSKVHACAGQAGPSELSFLKTVGTEG
jgi:hypothetical protein